MKLMKKVKSQWVAVGKTGMAIAALATVAVGGSLMVDADEDVSVVKTEQSIAAENESASAIKDEVETSAYNWVANTVSEVASEIEVQRKAGKSIYEIITGDTLWALSQATGISVEELAKLNGIENPDLIFAGNLLDGVLNKGVLTNNKTNVAVETTKPFVETKPDVTPKPTEPTKPVEPTVPTEPTKPVEPTVPTEPTKPVEPTEPTDPTDPTTPVDPTEPSENETETEVGGGVVTAEVVDSKEEEVTVDGDTYEERTTVPQNESTFIGEEVETIIPAVTEDVVIPAVIEHVEAVYETVQVPVLDEEGNETGEFTEEQKLVTEAYDKVIEPERIETVEVTPAIVVKERVDTLMVETPYEIITRYDGSIPEGTSYVEVEGSRGLVVVPITVTVENGIQVSSVNGPEQFIFAPTNEVVVVGTQKVVTVVTNTIKETTTTPYTQKTIEDNSLFVGETVVDVVGQEGKIVTTYTQTITDGVTGEKVQIGSEVIESVTGITRVGTKEVKQEVRETEIPFETVIQYDENAYADSSVVTTEGQNGTKATTYDVTYVKGQKVSETVVSEEVTVAPVNKVITVGTKVIETTGTVKETEEVAFETITKYDTNLAEGTIVVETEGQTGTKEITYDVKYNKGEEVSRTVASEVVTKAPVNKVVVVGAQNIEVKQEIVTTPVAYDRTTIYDDTKYTDFYEVTVKGVSGVLETTYNVTYVNGVKTSEEAVSSRVSVMPIQQVATVGTKAIETNEFVNATEDVAFETITKYDNTLAVGTEVVENEGQVGSKDLIYEVTYNKGVEVSRKLVSETVTKAPINRVIVVGTKAKSEVTYGEEYTSIENEVAYETTYVENANLDKGVENVVTEGSNGFDTVVSRDVLENGVKVTTEVVSRQTTAAVTEVIEVGTKIPAMTIEALQATIDMELLNQEFLVLLNELRVSAGRGVVYYAAEYQDEADTRALEEVEQTVASFEAGNGWDIDHERTDGSAWYEVFENRDFGAGENLLGNSIASLDTLTDIDEKALAYSMFKQWEASTGHRDNMIGNNFTTNTVSVQLINVDGYVYYVGSELLTGDADYMY